MNKYEEIIYSLIYNCNREVTVEEKQILNQASAIYNTYNQLTEQLGCPLEVIFKALRQGYIYTLVEKDYIINLKIDEQCFFIVGYKDTNVSTTFNVYLNNYKKNFWLKEDRSE